MDPGATMTQPQGAPQGASQAASNLAYHMFGRNPAMTGVIFMAMLVVLLIFIVLFIVYRSKYEDCAQGGKNGFLGTSPYGNLNTGSNNPLWQLQMGDAGWGGSVHSTYQPGESRVYGASADGGHTMTAAPVLHRKCGTPVSPSAMGEAQALTAAQAFYEDPPSGGAPAHKKSDMSDDALVRVMNGDA